MLEGAEINVSRYDECDDEDEKYMHYWHWDIYKEADWYDLIFDATGEKKGKLLLAYGLFQKESD